MGRLMERGAHAITIALSCLLLFGSINVSASSDAYVDVEQLTADLKTNDIDRIVMTLNTVKRMSYQGEILPFIRDLWEDRKDKYPELPWKTINADIVKVNLADILLQAESNGKTKIQKEKLHQYVTEKINSADVDVARTAILILSLIDDEKDVDRVLAIAKQQTKGTFRASVIALSKMCNTAAHQALDQLSASLKDKESKSFISETRREMQSFKKTTRWCDAKS